jgi:hypothetical protein
MCSLKRFSHDFKAEFAGEIGVMAMCRPLEMGVLFCILSQRNLNIQYSLYSLFDRESLCRAVFKSDSKLKEIGYSAFSGSVIKSIRIPSNAESIGRYCFSQCKFLCKVVFESNSKLKAIADFAFYYSGVKTIELPEQCEVLTGNSLVGLEFVTISKGNKCLMCEDNFLFGISGNILIRYFGKSNKVLIKSFIENISKGCFYECKSLCEVLRIRFKIERNW